MKHHYPNCELGDRCNCDAIDEELDQLDEEPMSTTPPTHSYRILRDNKTKPVRYIVLIDGKIYVEGVTRTVAREIVAGHMLRVHPDVGKQMREVVDHISSSGI